jgi:hypothetical protein
MITSILYKKRRVRRLDAESETFRSLINNLRLVEIPSSGGLFTWNKKRGVEK